MKRTTLLVTLLIGGLILTASALAQGQASGDAAQAKQKSASLVQEGKAENVDFERARKLMERRKQGDKLTEAEEAYLRRAIAAKKGGKGAKSGAAPDLAPLTPRETTGLKPLSDMSASDRYKGEDGGLYGGGRNMPPDAHQRAADSVSAKITPLDAAGQPDADGKIVFVSISMSNATQEFSRFKQVADASPVKSPRVTIVDCAQGGQAMAQWARPDAPPWSVAHRRLENAQVSPRQVQVAWIKLANVRPTGELSEHGRKLQRDTLTVIQLAKAKFPSLRIAYLSSRIYGGYATTPLNPEPYAYESAFAARWLIQDQMRGDPELKFSANGESAKAPLLLWGPYLWADGTTPRSADKLIYTRSDLVEKDGTHPSEAGRDKVAGVMLDFFSTSPLAKGWFAK